MKFAPRPWVAAASGDRSAQVDYLVQSTGLSPLTVQACLSRGLVSAEGIQEFLNPRLDRLRDPLTIEDMGIAVDRLLEARAAGAPVRVFGDYDVDGTSGAALLGLGLGEMGFEVSVRQPDRFKDGYGLNVGAIESAHAEGISLVVTVDCGISSFAPIERSVELGVDVIVVDHHQVDPERGIPPALAVVDPQRPDCASGLKELCGCGLAFYLLRALRTAGRDQGLWSAENAPNLKRHLDLVVLATAADLVPLTGDNHTLVRHGLEVLKQTQKPGLRALLAVSGLESKSLSPGSLGFTLGPRINASGRMGSAAVALELLMTRDDSRGLELAHELERLNAERQQTQLAIWDQVRARVEAGFEEGLYRSAVAIGSREWHEGVVGIVASRVTEGFRRPAAVIGIREHEGEWIGKGSVRSFGGVDVLEALRRCSDVLLGFGGHRHAAGLSLRADRLDEFATRFDQAVSELKREAKRGGDEAARHALTLEGECTLADLDLKALTELERLGPFGPGNPEPVFGISATIEDARILKDRHFKLRLGSPEASMADSLEAIWFFAAESEELRTQVQALTRPEQPPARFAGVPELNRFRGRVTPTFRVRDWKPAGSELDAN